MKAFVRGIIERVAAAVYQRIGPRLAKIEYGTNSNASAIQLSLSMQYKRLFQEKANPLRFSDVGFQVNSQHEEDGILLYIFALIGTTNKKCVEVCAGDGIECNTANLIINHKWSGLLLDGNSENISKAQEFYSKHPATTIWPPVIKKEWITRDNINSILSDNGFNSNIDLLSLDIDGVDYWLWKAIDVVSPRVVVLEFNHLLGPERSVTIPYSDSFVAEYTQYGSDYAGASLAAFVKLGRQKGYRLVGTNAFATNAFFIRNDIENSWLPEVDPKDCFDHPRAQFGMKVRYPQVASKPWVEV